MLAVLSRETLRLMYLVGRSISRSSSVCDSCFASRGSEGGAAFRLQELAEGDALQLAVEDDEPDAVDGGVAASSLTGPGSSLSRVLRVLLLLFRECCTLVTHDRISFLEVDTASALSAEVFTKKNPKPPLPSLAAISMTSRIATLLQLRHFACCTSYCRLRLSSAALPGRGECKMDKISRVQRPGFYFKVDERASLFTLASVECFEPIDLNYIAGFRSAAQSTKRRTS